MREQPARSPVASAPEAAPRSAQQAAPSSSAPAPAQQATAAASPTATRPATATATQAAAQRPRFDVVRVGLRGTAVVAGRAAPGSEVVLFADGRQELGRARADSRGEWVILPAEALAPGSRELSLRARLNGEDLDGADTVVILVPEAPSAATTVASAPNAAPPTAGPGALAVLMPAPGSNAAPRVLQAPPEASLPRPGQTPRLALSTVDYGEGGDMRFAGTATPNTTVRVYLGDQHAGDTTADATGRWTLTPSRTPPRGRLNLRVDQIATGGSVAARIEQPVENAPPADGVPHDGRLIVQPGHNLWRIARQTYGQGTRFTVIYAANRDQIRDPHRIYPGQVFALPDQAPSR
jgi:nucleoid-associated protein YgaU